MAYNLKYQQKLFQRMALTPQMRHSIKLLGMSTKDINEYIESAIESNPFLQKTYNKKNDSEIGVDFSSVKNSDYSYSQSHENKADSVDPRQSLMSQLRMLNLDDSLAKIAEQLVYDMDENGYITVSLDDIAHDFSASLEEVEETLGLIQTLDPAGIGARDITECLRIQLERMGKDSASLEYRIVGDFLSEIARDDIEKIAKSLGTDSESVRKAIKTIKKLNPRPASTMLSKSAEPIMPDMITKIIENKIHLRPNSKWLPSLTLYNPYQDQEDIMSDEESKHFVKENISSAKSLIDGLKRREETMCKVADFILNYHKTDVVKNVDEIKSLTIKDVAHALNLHPSTINRAVSNKFIEINNKVMPLKNLLSQAVKKENGEHTSRVAVKKMIQDIIKSEDKADPLSDQAVLEKMANEGIIIKRRTIAKYRNSLKILPTHLRRKARSA